MNLLFLLWAIPTWAANGDVVSLSRYFTIKTCDAHGQCAGPVAENVALANVSLELTPFHKGKAQGWDARDRKYLEVGAVKFESEIHLIKYANPGKYKYYVYAMLRSGKREGKIKKINLKSLDELGVIELTDDPVSTSGGSIQAQIVLGPPLPKSKRAAWRDR